jgi:hypothetical protein
MTYRGILLSVTPDGQLRTSGSVLLCLEAEYFSVLWAGERIERPFVSPAKWKEIADHVNAGLPSTTDESISPVVAARINDARHMVQDLLGHLVAVDGSVVRVQWLSVLLVNVPEPKSATASLDTLLRSADLNIRAEANRLAAEHARP